MSRQALFLELLRPPVLHILRAAGFHATRQAPLDALIDITARYLILVATKAAETSWLITNSPIPTVTDVRLALQDMGAFRPQLTDMEEQFQFDDDMRGVDAFVNWFSGDANKEITRIAGLLGPMSDIEIEAGVEREDFLTVLKKKHSKTGEEAKFQGTVLGKDIEEHSVPIDGDAFESVRAWESARRQRTPSRGSSPARSGTSLTMSAMSSPLSEPGSDDK